MKGFKLLCAVVTLGFGIGTASASVVSFAFTASIGTVYSPTGTLSGTFSFDTNQTPVPIPSNPTVVTYQLTGFQVSNGTQTVVFNKVSGVSDYWIAMGNAGTGDFFSVRMEDSLASPPTLNGVPVSDLDLIWSDPTFTAFSSGSYPLPTSTSYFAALPTTIVNIDDLNDFSAPLTSDNGVINSVAEVPLPPSSVLLLSGVFALLGAGLFRFGTRARS